MPLKLLRKIFKTRNDRVIQRKQSIIKKINSLESHLESLTEAELQAKTTEFKERVKQNESLDDLLPEAFAVVREASKRIFGMRHFDVQLLGGIILHEGHIAEMKTGEGKTLTATLPAYLNALTGESVHIVTVNDYLASRDAKTIAPLFNYLGLTVAANVHGLSPEEKKAVYTADILYGTNNEFGFDYLRDNMVFSVNNKTQRGLAFAIVDEVDSVLIDEARTPLVISGAPTDSSELYQSFDKLVPDFVKQEKDSEDGEPETGDYTVDEKSKQIYLTERGHDLLEDLLRKNKLLQDKDSLFSATQIHLLHHMTNALRAHTLYEKDVDYVITDEEEIVIVDEHTGRMMPGRRWSDGLHQSIEAKEKVAIQAENKTMASITFQNYFRMYDKLSGMTGTADTEAYEFQDIYHLETIVIPTNRQMVRADLSDKVYLTKEVKYKAICEHVKDLFTKGQPVLIGTVSIEDSELLSALLKKENIKHNVLNAKFHEQEATIIANAGKKGAVTIATNMAGRGTDIVLGGSKPESKEEMEAWRQDHQEVLDLGGLFILGSERHESRRIDNQLRGRSGRQGDPGASQFYLSLDDSLMRLFLSERMINVMRKLASKDETEELQGATVSKSIESAQKKVESFYFESRKNLIEYDDVANDQRQVIYEKRDELLDDQLDKADIDDLISQMNDDVVNAIIDDYIAPQSLFEQWDISGLMQRLKADLFLDLPIDKWLDEDKKLYEEPLREKIVQIALENYTNKIQLLPNEEAVVNFEKYLLLDTLDKLWRDHLSAMDNLRQGINLRGYAQKNPKQEYKRESFEMFEDLLHEYKYEVISILAKIDFKEEDGSAELEHQAKLEQELQAAEEQAKLHQQNAARSAFDQKNNERSANPLSHQNRIDGAPVVEPRRNKPCPCGSGKKYKHCHGKNK